MAEDFTRAAPAPTGRVEHSSPGRLRVRLARTPDSSQQLEALSRHFEHHPAVRSAEINPQTRSILILGHAGADLRAATAEMVQLSDACGDNREPGVDAIVSAVKQVNGRVRQASHGRVSLRVMVPAAFVGFGIRQLVAEGLTLGGVPWFVLIYYGVDSFLKLYPEHAPRVIPETASDTTP